MTTAFDIQKYERCIEMAEEHEMTIEVRGGSGFALKRGKRFFGVLATVDELYSYLCGYSAGKDEH
ncbi:MAG: hypothetical protein UY18_C0050G0013 [Microgenomates group bacterium GW2011_GWF2_47_9]|nr:MAG: hypothetical protein UY18_C0050G0013 [Microgenomates group bacterium GW2011_GWF2_47_9]